MRFRTFLPVLAVTAAVCFLAGVGFGEDEPAGEAEWLKLAAPGENHEWFGFMAGTWKAEAKMWMEPGADPVASEGVYLCEWRCDGRYMASSYDGAFMGQPYHGEGYMGYNNITKQYESLWVDTMNTVMSVSKGTRTGDVLTTHNAYEFPGMSFKTREVTTKVGPDEFKMEHYHTQSGQSEAKVMEIVFRRAE
jgi:hypothetical protein